MFKIVSIVVMVLLIIGLFNRRTPRIHIPLMSVAFVTDLLLVLYIEWKRSVVEMVVEESASMPLLLQIHVPISIIAFLLYFPLITLGILLARGKKYLQPWHRRFGITFIIFRSLNLITSFFI